MKVINAHNVYSLVLTELEWYAGTEQQRNAWEVRCAREAEENNCRYATIMVEPEAVMSIPPEPERHKVWYKTLPVAAETDFENALLDVYARSKLNGIQKAAIIRRVLLDE